MRNMWVTFGNIWATYVENTPAVFLTFKSMSTNHGTCSDPKFFEKAPCLESKISAVGFIKLGFLFFSLFSSLLRFKE